MKFLKIVCLMVFFICLMQPALAEDFTNFNMSVNSGMNVLDFGIKFDGRHVSSVVGTFNPLADVPYRSKIYILADNPMQNATIKLNVNYMQFMRSDFSDLDFRYENGTRIQHYISSKNNSSNATVYLKLDLPNDIYVYFGGSTTLQNSTGMFLYTQSNLSLPSNQTLYTGAYTNVDLLYSATGMSSSQYSRFFFMPVGTDLPYVGYSLNRSIFADSNSSTWLNYSTSNPILSLSLQKNGAMVEREMSIPGAYNLSSFPNPGLSVVRFNESASAINTQLHFIGVYNSVPFSYSFGQAETTPAGVPSNINLNYPEGVFSTLSFNAPQKGYVLFNVHYTPHFILLTQEGANFNQTALLQFQSNPSGTVANYQIAIDSNFYSVVNTGFSTGNITTTLPEGNYFWRVKQPDGSFSDVRRFSVSNAPPIPGSFNFTIRNELNNSAVSATVRIANSTTTLQKTGSTVLFNSSEVAAGNYSVQVSANGYTTRFYEVVSPGNYTLWILPTTANYSVVYFSLIDNTNVFRFDATKLEIIKQTPNGSIVIQNSYFDASGLVVASLNQFDSYILKVISDDGVERVLGNYIQAGQTSVQLVISEIILKNFESDIHGGFSYNLTRSPEMIKLEWVNSNNSLTEPFLFQILKDGVVVMDVNSEAPFGLINYVEDGGLDPDATYRIIFTAKTVNGTIRVNELYKIGGEPVSIDFEKIPIEVRIVVSLILLILVASLFNITNAKFAAIVVTVVAGFLSMIGFLPILPAVVIWVLFVAAVSYKTNG
jgi:hypothetical protein